MNKEISEPLCDDDYVNVSQKSFLSSKKAAMLALFGGLAAVAAYMSKGTTPITPVPSEIKGDLPIYEGELLVGEDTRPEFDL